MTQTKTTIIQVDVRKWEVNLLHFQETTIMELMEDAIMRSACVMG